MSVIPPQFLIGGAAIAIVAGFLGGWTVRLFASVILVKSKRSLGTISNGARNLEIFKRPKPDDAALVGDFHIPHPCVFAATNTHHSTCVVEGNFLVPTILNARNMAEVGNPIVGSDAVDVVNIFIGPLTVVECPAHPMRSVVFGKNVASLVAITVHAAQRLLASVTAVPSCVHSWIVEKLDWALSPKKKTAIWIVTDQLREVFNTDMKHLSHAAVLSRLWSGVAGGPIPAAPFSSIARMFGQRACY